MGKAPCCSKVGLHKGPWSTKEDMVLTNYIQTHGEGLWRSLPKKAGLLRCGKSCRLRWMNYLRPGLKRGNISADEEDLIIRLHTLLGNRWSLIAGRLPGRTDNEIKNYWNTHLIKKLKNSGIELNEKKIVPKKGKNNESKKKASQKKKKKLSNSENEELKCSEEIKKDEVVVPKPIRIFSRSSSNNTRETALSSSSSHEVTKEEVKMENTNDYENVQEKMWSFPDMELCGLGDVNFDQICCEGENQVLIDGCQLLYDEDLMMPTINNMMEIVYDEYFQLL